MSTLYFSDVSAEVQIPEKGFRSRTLHDDDHVKVLLFGFAPGHELAPHTAPMATSLYSVEGEATVTLGDETREVKPGTYVYSRRC